MAAGAGQRQKDDLSSAPNPASHEGPAVPQQPTVAVTGASGFIGSALCAGFAARGWKVRAGVRDPGSYTGPGGAFACDLPGHLDTEALAGAAVVIHAAWEMRYRERRRALATNLGGSRKVLEAARAGHARVVFVSSCSAHRKATSLYGRSKLAVERLLDPSKDLVIRPGLVVGPGGLFARLVNGVARSPIIPLFDGGRQPVQTIAIGELCEGIVRAVEEDHTGRLVLAHPDGLTFRALLSVIARELNRRPIFLPISATPFLWAARTAEGIGLTLPFSSENLLGLRSMVKQPSADDLKKLNLVLDPPAKLVAEALGERDSYRHGGTKSTEEKNFTE